MKRTLKTFQGNSGFIKKLNDPRLDHKLLFGPPSKLLIQHLLAIGFKF